MSDAKLMVFDVETTGTDKQQDQVIELCAQWGLASDATSMTWRIRPQVPMNPAAQLVHGISMNDLAGCPQFAEVADELRDLFADAEILVGYNIRFDIDMVQAEYKRLRQPQIELEEKLIVDAYRLWQNSEPRSLMDAHRRFVGTDFAAAHSAAADVAATGRVLDGMIKAFGLEQNWHHIADICEPTRKHWMGGSHHVCWDDQHRVVFGFGKHLGVELSDMASGANAGYLKWIVGKDFPSHVVEICSQALRRNAAEFLQWAESQFPRRGTEILPSVVAPIGAVAPREISESDAKPISSTIEPECSTQQLLFDLG